MNKKGQMYLVAAIILVLAISGIASVRTYAEIKSEPRKVQDLGSELTEEGVRIVDYGIYSRQNLTRILNNFTDTEFAPYFLKKTDNTSIVFVYGDVDELYSVQYLEQYTGTVYATLGGAAPAWQPASIYAERKLITDHGGVGSMLEVNVFGKIFEFEIREEEMFYFLITQEKEGEFYVERN